MKQYSFLFILLFCLCCSGPKLNPAIVIDETTNPTQEELYHECAELKGIGNLIVGKTPLDEALKDPECNLYEHAVNFSSKGIWAINNDKERSWIMENHPELARYKCSGSLGSMSNNYMIGDYTLHDMFAVFYKGILAAVAYDCSDPKLYNLIKEKYGSGDGEYHYYFQDNDPATYPYYRRRHKVNIDKIWENEKVIMHYYFNLSQVQGYSDAHISEEHYCVISDKDLIELYDKSIEDAINDYHEIREAEKKRTESRL